MKYLLLALLVVLPLCSCEVVGTVIVDVSDYMIPNKTFTYRVAAFHAAIQTHVHDDVDKTIFKLPGGTYTYCEALFNTALHTMQFEPLDPMYPVIIDCSSNAMGMPISFEASTSGAKIVVNDITFVGCIMGCIIVRGNLELHHVNFGYIYANYQVAPVAVEGTGSLIVDDVKVANVLPSSKAASLIYTIDCDVVLDQFIVTNMTDAQGVDPLHYAIRHTISGVETQKGTRYSLTITDSYFSNSPTGYFIYSERASPFIANNVMVENAGGFRIKDAENITLTNFMCKGTSLSPCVNADGLANMLDMTNVSASGVTSSSHAAIDVTYNADVCRGTWDYVQVANTNCAKGAISLDGKCGDGIPWTDDDASSVKIRITNLEVKNNIGQRSGAGLWTSLPNIEIGFCSFDSNTAMSGKAAAIASYGPIKLAGCQFQYNTAPGTSVMLVSNTSPAWLGETVVDSVVIMGNAAVYPYGPLELQSKGIILLSNIDLLCNQVTQWTAESMDSLTPYAIQCGSPVKAFNLTACGNFAAGVPERVFEGTGVDTWDLLFSPECQLSRESFNTVCEGHIIGTNVMFDHNGGSKMTLYGYGLLDGAGDSVSFMGIKQFPVPQMSVPGFAQFTSGAPVRDVLFSIPSAIEVVTTGMPGSGVIASPIPLFMTSLNGRKSIMCKNMTVGRIPAPITFSMDTFPATYTASIPSFTDTTPNAASEGRVLVKLSGQFGESAAITKFVGIQCVATAHMTLEPVYGMLTNNPYTYRGATTTDTAYCYLPLDEIYAAGKNGVFHIGYIVHSNVISLPVANPMATLIIPPVKFTISSSSGSYVIGANTVVSLVGTGFVGEPVSSTIYKTQPTDNEFLCRMSFVIADEYGNIHPSYARVKFAPATMPSESTATCTFPSFGAEYPIGTKFTLSVVNGNGFGVAQVPTNKPISKGVFALPNFEMLVIPEDLPDSSGVFYYVGDLATTLADPANYLVAVKGALADPISSDHGLPIMLPTGGSAHVYFTTVTVATRIANKEDPNNVYGTSQPIVFSTMPVYCRFTATEATTNIHTVHMLTAATYIDKVTVRCDVPSVSEFMQNGQLNLDAILVTGSLVYDLTNITITGPPQLALPMMSAFVLQPCALVGYWGGSRSLTRPAFLTSRDQATVFNGMCSMLDNAISSSTWATPYKGSYATADIAKCTMKNALFGSDSLTGALSKLAPDSQVPYNAAALATQDESLWPTLTARLFSGKTPTSFDDVAKISDPVGLGGFVTSATDPLSLFAMSVYKCQFNDSRVTEKITTGYMPYSVSLTIYGHEYLHPQVSVVGLVNQPKPTTIIGKAGNIGTIVTVVGSGFVDTSKHFTLGSVQPAPMGLGCEFVSEYVLNFNPLTDTLSDASLYDTTRVAKLFAHHSQYMNSNSVMCEFGQFAWAYIIHHFGTEAATGEYVRITPGGSAAYSPTPGVDAVKLDSDSGVLMNWLVKNMLYQRQTFRVGLSNDGGVTSVLTSSPVLFTYSNDAYITSFSPPRGNVAYAHKLLVFGKNFVPGAEMTCWFVEVDAAGGPIPPSPLAVPSGMFSAVVQASAVHNEEYLECSVPPPGGMLRTVGVVVSLNGQQYDTSVVKYYEYTGTIILAIDRAPSTKTLNFVPLAVQPKIKMTIQGGYTVHPSASSVFIHVAISPPPTSYAGDLILSNRTAGYAEYKSLQITGPQGAKYELCFSPKDYEGVSYCHPVLVEVAPCSEIQPHMVIKPSTDECTCDIGYQLTVQQNCSMCPIGYYRESLDTTTCTKCPYLHTTKYEGSLIRSQCVCHSGFITTEDDQCMCRPGYYFKEGFDQCWGCPVGTYQDSISQNTTCIQCPDPHSTTETIESSSLANCTCKMSFQKQPTAELRCMCPPGTEYDGVNRQCQACPLDLYAEAPNLKPCTPCDGSMRTVRRSSKYASDCVCKEGYFAPINPHARNATISKCDECPIGAICNGGGQQPFAGPGYFSSESENVFLRCQVADACEGQDKCAPGYKGRLCGECAIGYYRLGQSCKECDNWADVVLFLALIIGLAALAALFYASYNPSPKTRFAALRIGWSYIQVTSLYSQFALNWPPEIEAVYRFFSIINLNIQITSPECSLNSTINFYSLFLFKFLLPFVLLLTLLAIYGGCFAYAKLSKSIADKARQSVLGSLKSALIRSSLLTLVMFYVPLCHFMLQYFDCDYKEDGTWSLSLEPAERCYTARHISWLPLTLVGVCLFVIGIPAFCYYVLFKYRAKIYESPVSERYGFLVSRFVPNHWYWEIVLLIRTGLLVVCLTLLDSIVPVQVMCGIAILGAAALLQVKNQPFISPYLNQLDTSATVASVVALLAGQVFYSNVQNQFVHVLLVIIMLSLLFLCMVFVGVVVYMDWTPPEDANETFAKSAGQSYESDFSSVGMSSMMTTQDDMFIQDEQATAVGESPTMVVSMDVEDEELKF